MPYKEDPWISTLILTSNQLVFIDTDVHRPVFVGQVFTLKRKHQMALDQTLQIPHKKLVKWILRLWNETLGGLAWVGYNSPILFSSSYNWRSPPVALRSAQSGQSLTLASARRRRARCRFDSRPERRAVRRAWLSGQVSSVREALWDDNRSTILDPKGIVVGYCSVPYI